MLVVSRAQCGFAEGVLFFGVKATSADGVLVSSNAPKRLCYGVAWHGSLMEKLLAYVKRRHGLLAHG